MNNIFLYLFNAHCGIGPLCLQLHFKDILKFSNPSLCEFNKSINCSNQN